MLVQKNKAGMVVGSAVAVLLTIFTAWRTIDLLSQLLPASQSLATIFGVAAFDGGLLAWTYLFLKAKSSDQRGVAGTMAGIDFLAVGLATVLDLIAIGVAKGAIAQNPNLYIGAIIVVAVVVMLNVGGGLLYAMFDPKTKQESRDQRAHNKINDLADQQIEHHAELYAPQFAQVKVEAWLAKARMQHGIPQLQQFTNGQPQLPTGPVVDASQPLPQRTGGVFSKIGNFLAGTSQPADLQAQPQTTSTSVPPQLEHDAVTGQWHIVQAGQTSPFAPAPSKQNGADSNSPLHGLGQNSNGVQHKPNHL